MPTLYYVHDPMCSWCWGYQPTLQRIEQKLGTLGISFTKLVGGLAPDSDTPMPLDMREAIQGYWRTISAKLGTEFNHDFWDKNIPRRSTYPACRALLIARQSGLENEMNHAIQQAYYLDAKNPSDDSVLCAIAHQIGLALDDFKSQLNSTHIQNSLLEELSLARSIGGNSFPSWILVHNNETFAKQSQHIQPLDLNYTDETQLIETLIHAFIK